MFLMDASIENIDSPSDGVAVTFLVSEMEFPAEFADGEFVLSGSPKFFVAYNLGGLSSRLIKPSILVFFLLVLIILTNKEGSGSVKGE